MKKEWFLDKQVSAWKSSEKFVSHRFSNTLVFVAIFILGGLSVFLLSKGSALQQIENLSFWGSLLHCLVFLTVGLAVYFFNHLKKATGAAIYEAYILNSITQSAYLDELNRYESDLLQHLNSLTFSFQRTVSQLSDCDPIDTHKRDSILLSLNEFTERLAEIESSLYDLRNIRESYMHDECFDLEIRNAIIEHKK